MTMLLPILAAFQGLAPLPTRTMLLMNGKDTISAHTNLGTSPIVEFGTEAQRRT